ncbi:J domain-containing protein [Deinococcus sp. YIM 134068]|uniref:J domain-containing protein n=1 Tax=Deinococcus lichenicola TaxID=3118910 RepID=UPI002F91E433
MAARRVSPGQRVSHLLGRLGARGDQMFHVPGLRLARPLLAASAAFTVFLITGVAFQRDPWLVVGVPLALFLLALCLLPRIERLLAVGWLALPFALSRLFPDGGWVLWIPFVTLVALAFFVSQRPTLPFDAQLGRLRGALGEGWKAYLPRNMWAHDDARVLVSPEGQTFLVGVTFGRAVQQYGKPFVNWQGVTQETVRDLAAQDWGVAGDAQKVLWVVRPRRAQGDYPPTAEHGVTTVIATAAGLATQLKSWAQMRQNLSSSPSPASPPSPAPMSPSEFGREVETQAADAVQKALPPDWKLQRNVLLAVGGDADLLLISPAGTRFAVDIKSRLDYMKLDTPRGERAKSWQEIHDQVLRAARQLGAMPVVWQALAQEELYKQVGEVWCVRGAPDGLHMALAVIERQEASGRDPYEVLGVRPSASRDEVQAAYRALVKQYHPDRVGHLGEEFRLMAEQRMQEINAAYRKLMG